MTQQILVYKDVHNILISLQILPIKNVFSLALLLTMPTTSLVNALPTALHPTSPTLILFSVC